MPGSRVLESWPHFVDKQWKTFPIGQVTGGHSRYRPEARPDSTKGLIKIAVNPSRNQYRHSWGRL